MRSRLYSKVITSVSVIAFTGLVTLAFYVNYTHEQELTEQNRLAMIKVLDSASMALVSLMKSGYADMGEVLHESLEEMNQTIRLQVTRLDGTQAFVNNRTINKVNEKLGYDRFALHLTESDIQTIELSETQLKDILDRGELFESVSESTGGNQPRVQTLIKAIPSERLCQRCHDEDHQYLGFIQLQASLKHIDETLAESRRNLILIMVATLSIIIVIIHLYIRRIILPPVLHLSQVISKITGQNLHKTIDLVSHVEFSRIASIFNLMVERLADAYDDLKIEKDKLSTLLLDASEGIVVTDEKSNIILVNDAACRLLDKSEKEIIQGSLATLFDEASFPIDTIHEDTAGTIQPRQIPYRNQVLMANVARVLTQAGVEVGAAAIFKDITEEVRLKDELKKLARTDALTGLYNRRHLDEMAENELNRAKRYNHPVCLLMFDIDHFKKVNDTWGHDIGDTVIKAVADIAKQNTKEHDILSRYGGEEYVMLLPNTTAEAGQLIAEKLRSQVEGWEQNGLKVTISIGITASPPWPMTELEGLIKLADLQLYRAKEGGRNKVCYQTPEES